MYLIDTMVLSELRKLDRNPGVVAWIEAQRTNDLFISVITIGEIERGIESQRGRNPAFAAALAGWLDRVLILYGDRIVGIDVGTARRWGRLGAEIGHSGALERGLTVVTRNVRHFTATGVVVLDPFS